MGKGSGRRPTDEDAYKANYDAIFGKKEREKTLPQQFDEPEKEAQNRESWTSTSRQK